MGHGVSIAAVCRDRPVCHAGWRHHSGQRAVFSPRNSASARSRTAAARVGRSWPYTRSESRRLVRLERTSTKSGTLFGRHGYGTSPTSATQPRRPGPRHQLHRRPRHQSQAQGPRRSEPKRHPGISLVREASVETTKGIVVGPNYLGATVPPRPLAESRHPKRFPRIGQNISPEHRLQLS